MNSLNLLYILCKQSLKSLCDAMELPYVWNYWRVKYLVNHSKNAIGQHFN